MGQNRKRLAVGERHLSVFSTFCQRRNWFGIRHRDTSISSVLLLHLRGAWRPWTSTVKQESFIEFQSQLCAMCKRCFGRSCHWSFTVISWMNVNPCSLQCLRGGWLTARDNKLQAIFKGINVNFPERNCRILVVACSCLMCTRFHSMSDFIGMCVFFRPDAQCHSVGMSLLCSVALCEAIVSPIPQGPRVLLQRSVLWHCFEATIRLASECKHCKQDKQNKRLYNTI